MRTVSPIPDRAGTTDALMMAGLPAWRGARHSERMGNTPSSTVASPPDHQGRGFRVDGGLHRQLDQQARRLGFADLRACLHALLEDGWSVPQLAARLATTQPTIRRAISHYRIPQPSRRQRLARQRQRAAQQRAAARAAELGVAGVRAYLLDRLVTHAWTLQEVRGELGAAPTTLRRLLDQHQVRRVAPTKRQRAAADVARGPKQRARAARRRQARLAELGFTDVDEYLHDRSVGRAGRCGGWAPNSASVMAGWTGSWPGSGYGPDRTLSRTAVEARVGGGPPTPSA